MMIGQHQQQQQQQMMMQPPMYGGQGQMMPQSAQFNNAYNNVEPRTREERAGAKDRERVEQMRLRERIGSYHKYMDNALVNNPDPTSSHFLPNEDRFNRDFASYDKQKREEQHKARLQNIELKRVEKYERDMKRWEFMDDEGSRDAQKMQIKQQQANTGRANKGGAAFNILNLQYEQNQDGQILQQKDEDKRARDLLRSKHVDMRGNSGYNLVNGNDRYQINVPQHPVYNPPDSLKSVGARILGDGFAGRPVRKELFDPQRPTGSQNSQSQPQMAQYGGGQGNYGQPMYQQQQMPNQQQQQQFQGFPSTNQGGFQGFQAPQNNAYQGYSGQVPQVQAPAPSYGGGASSMLPINQQQQVLYGGPSGAPQANQALGGFPQSGNQQTRQSMQNIPSQNYSNGGGAGTKFY